MAHILTDDEIRSLLDERKVAPKNWKTRLKPCAVRGQPDRRRSWTVTGANGNNFRVDVRDNPNVLFDFSIILSLVERNGDEYRLVRFNGKHRSRHTNKWEKNHGEPNAQIQIGFHIHTATERYQLDLECKIDGYAETTNQYHSFDSALTSFMSSHGFLIESMSGGSDLLFDDASEP